jgi:hypothetical protein
MGKNSMPWESGSAQGKYQYHPGGDANAPLKDAPSAINVVVVPDVNLPKVRFRHELSGDGRWSTGLTDPPVAEPPRQVQQVGQGGLLDSFLPSGDGKGWMLREQPRCATVLGGVGGR